MSALTSVGIHDNFSTRQACISVRTSDDELACGVHIVLDIETKEVEHLLRVNLLLHTRDEDVDDIVFDLGKHLLVLVKFIVLCGDNNGVDTLRDTFVAILDGHLTL